jgi:hypothetical protein
MKTPATATNISMATNASQLLTHLSQQQNASNGLYISASNKAPARLLTHLDSKTPATAATHLNNDKRQLSY